MFMGKYQGGKSIPCYDFSDLYFTGGVLEGGGLQQIFIV